jgi:nucleotide-binding universal stress UspA family protein
MKSINKILFPTDFSETAQNAFRYCLILADQCGANIELLHVVYPEYETLDLPVLAAKATQDRAEAARILQQSFIEMGIAQVQLSYQFNSLPIVNADVQLGTPGSTITDIAKRDNVDLIVMGTKGEHNVLERFLGSVTTYVIEHAPCHVWVVPEQANFERIDLIAYASDLQDTDPYHILEVSKMLEPFSPIMHCIHVNKESSMDEALDFATLGNFIEHQAPHLQVSFHPLSHESVIKGIEEFVSENTIDLLVMFAPSHSWIDRIIHRSATKKMALDTHIPLLLLKVNK